MRNGLLAILAGAVTTAASLSGEAAVVTATWSDTSSYSGNPQSDMTITVPGVGDVTTGENVGLYTIKLGNGGVVRTSCLTPLGQTDFSTYSYNVLPFNDPGLPAIGAANSPPFTVANLRTAAEIFDTYAGQVSNPQQGWGLVAAEYSALYSGVQVTFTAQGQTDGTEAAFNTYSHNYAGNPAGYVLVPVAGQGGNVHQILLVDPSAVPEPSTVLAGGVALLVCGAAVFRGNHQRRIRLSTPGRGAV